MSKLKTSLLGRTPGLLKIAASVMASEIKERVTNQGSTQQLQEKILLAKKITTQLGDLKGAAMKLGQMLSIDAADYLPPEAMDVLSKLQKNAPPVDFKIIEQQLKIELGEKYSQVQIEKKALAVASIGQVHRAVYLERPIVLKVQYPEIDKTIVSDIKILKFVTAQGSNLMQKSINFDSLFDELQMTLLNETDYLLEGKHLRDARALFQHDSRFLIPQLIPELSSKRVLAMEFMEGHSFTDWLNANPSILEREDIGKKLFELFLKEFFYLGLVQTDPNPGNFLINTQGQIVLLDFGATKFYDRAFIEKYVEILRAAYLDDKESILKHSFDFNLISPKESEETLEYYYQLMTCMIEPFRQNRSFSFTDQNFLEDSRRLILILAKQCKYTPPSEKLIFLHRKLGGIYNLLKKMEVKINIHDYWREHFENWPKV